MKSIPIALQTHLNQDATTWCYLCQVRTKSGVVLGFSGLDVDVVYDDGAGEVTYRADNGGFAPDRIQAAADLAVDNTEMEGWISDTGITEQQIRAGLFDYARVKIYRVNYMDLSQGHEIMAFGTLGETKFSRTGWRCEFRSLKQQLKQPVNRMYSLLCPARFGSKPIGTGGPQPEEKLYCGKDWVWVDGTVSSVDAEEPDRIFEDDSATEATGYFLPGVIQWLTGDNAGHESDIESYVLSGGVGEFQVSLPLPFPAQPGDTYRRRQDCNKIAVGTEEVPGDCKNKHNNLLMFRGQHLIPLADASSSMIPGADVP